MNINCSLDCVWQHNGNCCLNSIENSVGINTNTQNSNDYKCLYYNKQNQALNKIRH